MDNIHWIHLFLFSSNKKEDLDETFLFQTMLENYTFLPFSMFLAVFWIFTYKKVPETKNKTFDEIATLFKIQNKQKWVHFYLYINHCILYVILGFPCGV